MATNRFFVSLDDKGQPLRQRNSVKTRPFLAASYDGDSFSSKPPTGAYPRKVIEVAKAIEWVARGTLNDGSKISARSKSGPIGGYFVRYSYLSNANTHETVERTTHHETADAWQKYMGSQYKLLAFARFESLEIRNWPTAGDSIVLPDAVAK
jgi:hypothetical protein